MPISTLYDKVVAGFNQATDRLKATPENIRILNIAPTVHADHNTIAEVEVDLYPELEALQPLPVGATQRYVKRQLTYTRAHITTALQSLLGVPNGAYFFDSALLATVNKASLVNYFNEIGIGLSVDEFELRQAGEQYGLVTDKSINFYGSVWFTTTGKSEPTPPVTEPEPEPEPPVTEPEPEPETPPAAPALVGGELTSADNMSAELGSEVVVTFVADPEGAEIGTVEWTVSSPELFAIVANEGEGVSATVTVTGTVEPVTQFTVTLTIGDEHIFERTIKLVTILE